MAVASPALAGRPLRDDLVNPRAPLPNSRPMSNASPMASTGYQPAGGIDKDADTMTLGAGSPLLPSLHDGEPEETTRAVSREELMGSHQDAQLIVGADAMGDEATLAVAPGQIDLGIDQGGLAAALAESIRRESQPNIAGAPAFPPPSQGFPNGDPMGSSGRLAAASPQGDPGGYGAMGGGIQQQQQPQQPQQPWGGEQAPPWSLPQPMSSPQGYDPLMPGPQNSPGMQGGYPQSGQHALIQQQQQQQQGPQGYAMQGAMGTGQGGYGSNPNMPTAQQPYPMGGMQGGGPLAPMPGQPPPWMQQQSHPFGQPSGGLSRSTKFTPQVILLVAVGAVCLAIFIIGIVLFVTTKF